MEIYGIFINLKIGNMYTYVSYISIGPILILLYLSIKLNVEYIYIYILSSTCIVKDKQS